MKSPFPYFGGKSRIAPAVWERFGNVSNYVEPFFGSGAVLLMRPHEPTIETVNDKDGMVSNFWRALRAEPNKVAEYADWPVNENDLHARHAWLVGHKDSLQARLEGDPDFYDTKVAGWWVWGMACWIGGGFCSGDGPWHVVDGALVNTSGAGQGVNRKRVHLGDAGQGVNRKRVHLGDAGQGVNRKREDLLSYFAELSERLRNVRVCCGDWSRVCGPSVTFRLGLTGVFLDPPYSDAAGRDNDIYRMESTTVAHDVREWAIANGDNPLMRIALCGYEGEHRMPESWECLAWNAGAGYGGQAEERTGNGKRERIWFSPACLRTDRAQQQDLFAPCATTEGRDP